MAQQSDYLNFIDMIDGGGPGRSGSEFKGGLLSGLLNMIGVNPYGYQGRMDAMQAPRPRMRPSASTTQPDARRPDGIGATPATAYAPPQQYSGSGMNPANVYQPTNLPVGPMDMGSMGRTSAAATMAANPDYGMPASLEGYRYYREPVTGQTMADNRVMRSPLTPQELELFQYIYGGGGYR
jgi:hypothetical protein